MNPTLQALLSEPWWPAIPAALFLLGVGLGSLIFWVRGQRQSRRDEAEITRLVAQLDAERRVGEERERSFDDARDQLEASFSLLSGQALQRNAESFMQMADSRLRQHEVKADGELAARQQAVESLVKPINETLKRAESQLQRVEQERKQSFGALDKQLAMLMEDQRALRAETHTLGQALKRPDVRGRWGEISLRRLVELAGMVDRCDFQEQPHVVGDQGAQRPDMVINLPDDRQIVVDAKTPLDGYLKAHEADSAEQRDRLLQKHASNVRAQVRKLSAKAYWEQLDRSPDFVVMFIPGEQFLTAALDHDDELLEDAMRQKVIIATPTSLIALLRAVAFSWRQLNMLRNAEEIRQLAEQFYHRVGNFSENMGKVGRALAKTVEEFNRATGSLERQVFPSAKRLSELGVSGPKEIETPEPIDKQVRNT